MMKIYDGFEVEKMIDYSEKKIKLRKKKEH
jgi:hypothetical protein